MTVKLMDDIGILVEDTDPVIGFFAEPGLELERRAPETGCASAQPFDQAHCCEA